MMYKGFVKTGDHGDVVFLSDQFVKMGSRITFNVETHQNGRLRAFDVSPYHDTFSPGSSSDSDFYA